ncbi:hypothetical protein AVEN_116599-1 [Araneus ventricosus]|uniref:Uncharacterized protein n=1 Tax=Araneus ventricosus TaxID=182803 RepID=A0A4Y2DDR4_ARAVE|nr:hypothetical protein AVEN_116599-1 [Araneus ventricosus]
MPIFIGFSHGRKVFPSRVPKIPLWYSGEFPALQKQKPQNGGGEVDLSRESGARVSRFENGRKEGGRSYRFEASQSTTFKLINEGKKYYDRWRAWFSLQSKINKPRMENLELRMMFVLFWK